VSKGRLLVLLLVLLLLVVLLLVGVGLAVLRLRGVLLRLRGVARAAVDGDAVALLSAEARAVVCISTVARGCVGVVFSSVARQAQRGRRRITAAKQQHRADARRPNGSPSGSSTLCAWLWRRFRGAGSPSGSSST